MLLLYNIPYAIKRFKNTLTEHKRHFRKPLLLYFK
jgi:hypothetical protein